MRLIDADELIKHIEKVYDGYDLNDVVEHWKDLVNKQPTIDPWHYPLKGEFPLKEQEYFVAFKTHREIYYDVRVLNSDLNSLLLACGEQIYAWQYIYPPKDVKNERS